MDGKGEPMSLINREALYEKTCGLEAQALAYVGKIVNDETKIEEWRIWSAILAERTAFKHDIFDAPEVKPEMKWIPVSERLPEKETVLATVETKTFKHRYVCEAVWIPRWTWKASFDSWEDCSEYNEDEDEYYVLEGWYERVHNWDDYSYVGIEDNVIAWQPMPEPYREEGE